MKTLEFSEDLLTGADEIDEQHRVLVDLINDLITGLDKEQGARDTESVLADLSRYIQVHFRTEEEFMARHGFVGLEEHIVIHRDFEAKAAQWENAFREGREEMILEILDYLCDWFIFHIRGSDRVMVHEVLHGVS